MAFITDGGWVLCPGVADARAAISGAVLCYGTALAIVLPVHSITDGAVSRHCISYLALHHGAVLATTI